jgi:putative toxin-antitoxin system antitoxin component (TIGR02293 family)
MATAAAIEPDLLQLAALNYGDQVRLAEEGLPTESVAQLRALGISFTEVAEIVIPPRTLKHRIARGERLSTEESERLLRVVRILAFADRVFGDHEKALGWLRIPDPRLPGSETEDRSCLSLLRTEAGGKAVESKLWAIAEGIYS